jgi:DNA polymerase-3 subunit alpha
MPKEHTFVHLNAHSSFSLLEGIPHVKTLAKATAKMEMPALGVTDKDNLFNAVEMSKYPAGEGVQPILGTQISITRGKNERGNWLKPHSVTLLVQNEQGWKNIVKLSSIAFLETGNEGVPQLTLEALTSHSKGLILLTGGAKVSPVTHHILNGDIAEAKKLLQTLSEAFSDRLYVELQRHGWEEEGKAESALIDLAYELNLPLVATNDARFIKKSQYNAFKAMLAIGDGITLNEKPVREFTEEHYLKTAEEMCALFADIPEATQNTVEIAKRCAYQVPTGINYMPAWRWHKGPGNDEIIPADEVENPPTDDEVNTILVDESTKRLEQRLEEFVYTADMTKEEKEAKHKIYFDRLKMELDVINSMGYAGYFLITSDFIIWSKKNDIPVGPGRGSGAGSVVAWALEITDVDPILWDLYFERFLNPERVSLPDFDIDFCQERRDEVIRYVQQKYGRACVSQIITFGTLKARACIRDVGRVLGLGFGQVGQIVAFIPEGPASIPIAEALETDERLKAIYDTDDDVRQLLDVSMEIEGCYRHASTHAAGIIIADRAITEVCPLYKDPRSDMPATQLAMFDAEYAGLVKFDFLGLKTLTTIQYATKMMAEKGVEVEMVKVPLDDEPTYEMLRKGHTVGVFQVESAGMTDCLKKMIPDKMQYLSDVIALYRPGPLGSGMVEDFIDCRHGRKEPNYPHPILEDVLRDTFGVPVYQEQVMRMAQDLAGYTLGGADILRRAMGKKKPAEMAKQRKIFVDGSHEKNNVTPEKANEIFDLMANFASYGFNKAHTIAYALIAYQTAWIKANHPLEFIAASMTMDRGNSDKVLKFKQELDRIQVPLLLPDVNKSELIFKVEEGKAIRFALGAIKGAGDESMRALIAERKESGEYTDIFDFVERQNPSFMNRRQLESLIKGGAFDSIESNRGFLMENVDMLLRHMQTTYTDKNSNQIGLFGEASTETLARPELEQITAWDLFETLENEQLSIGFYLSSHPLESFKEDLQKISGLVAVAELEELAGSKSKTVKVAALIMGKRELKTKRGDRMAIVTLSDTSGQGEVALFPESYASHYELIKKNQAVLCTLNIHHDGERLRINVEHMQDLDKALSRQDKLLLKIDNINSINMIKEMISQQEEGETMCEIFYTLPELGHAHVRLNKKIHASKRFLAQIETVPEVSIFN